LQSSNEELQTVNEELQQRNGILAQTSNDLTNLLNSVNLPLLMLNNDLQIRQFTPLTQRLMNVHPSDMGRSIGEIRLNLSVENLEPLLRDVLDSLGTRELKVQDRDGHWRLLRVRPYRTADNKIEGVVLVLMDIDELRRGQQELLEARDYARSVIESIKTPTVVLNTDLKIRTVNGAFRALASLPARDSEGRSFPDLAVLLWGLESVRERPPAWFIILLTAIASILNINLSKARRRAFCAFGRAPWSPTANRSSCLPLKTSQPQKLPGTCTRVCTANWKCKFTPPKKPSAVPSRGAWRVNCTTTSASSWPICKWRLSVSR
jgi:PAS domain-containing protein